MYGRILIPVDGSNNSGRAVDFCLKMLENQKAEKVVLLHAVSYPAQLDPYSGKMRSTLLKIKEQIREHGEKILADASNKIIENNVAVLVETKLVWGDPKYEIVAEVEEGEYSLLVIGSRGLSGIKSFILGSVGNYVAQHARCTVILVK